MLKKREKYDYLLFIFFFTSNMLKINLKKGVNNTDEL